MLIVIIVVVGLLAVYGLGTAISAWRSANEAARYSKHNKEFIAEIRELLDE